MLSQLTATVVSVTMLSPDFMALTLTHDTPGFTFQAGQFLMLQVPADPRPIFRAYSIASSPHAPSMLQFLIRYVRGGQGCEYIHSLHTGDTVHLRGPMGHMVLDTRTAPLLLIGVGCGIAPLLSIIRTQAQAAFPRPTTAYFGFKKYLDCVYIDELRGYEQEYPDRLHVQYCLSDAPPAPHGTIAGRVTTHIATWSDPTASVYLCGMPSMVDEAAPLLTSLGIPPEHLHSEKY